MTDTELLKILNKIEIEFQVDKWRIGELHVWPLLRIALAEDILAKLKDSPLYEGSKKFAGKNVKVALLKKVFNEITAFFSLYLGDHKNNYYCEEKGDVLTLMFNVDRHLNLRGKGKYNYIIEPFENIIEGLGYSVYNLEYIHRDFSLNKPRTNKSQLVNLSFLFGRIVNYIKKNQRNFIIDLPDYDLVDKWLRGAYGIIGLMDKNDLLAKIKMIASEAEFFGEILDKKRIRCALFPDWRNEHCMALVMACKKRRIPAVEIQHGHYGGDFFTHFGWNRVPLGGYELKPDYYWCWTKRTADRINAELNKGMAIAGCPPIMLAIKDDQNTFWKKEQNLLDNIIPADKKVVLVSLQNILYADAYPEWLIEIVEETNEEYYWLFRKHSSCEPSVQDIICEKIERFSNADWRLSSDLPLPLLLQNTNVHVTYYSSVVVEAAMLGVKSIILSDSLKNNFSEQLELGEAGFAGTKDEFMRLLLTYSGSKNKKLYSYETAIKELVSIIEGNEG